MLCFSGTARVGKTAFLNHLSSELAEVANIKVASTKLPEPQTEGELAIKHLQQWWQDEVVDNTAADDSKIKVVLIDDIDNLWHDEDPEQSQIEFISMLDSEENIVVVTTSRSVLVDPDGSEASLWHRAILAYYREGEDSMARLTMLRNIPYPDNLRLGAFDTETLALQLDITKDVAEVIHQYSAGHPGISAGMAEGLKQQGLDLFSATPQQIQEALEKDPTIFIDPFTKFEDELYKGMSSHGRMLLEIAIVAGTQDPKLMRFYERQRLPDGCKQRKDIDYRNMFVHPGLLADRESLYPRISPELQHVTRVAAEMIDPGIEALLHAQAIDFHLERSRDKQYSPHHQEPQALKHLRKLCELVGTDNLSRKHKRALKRLDRNERKGKYD